jgi:hypothetical protein
MTATQELNQAWLGWSVIINKRINRKNSGGFYEYGSL